MLTNKLALLMAEKETREKRRVTLTELSKDTGIAPRTLQQWYSNKIGRFDANVIVALCKYFRCQPGDLFEYKEN